MRTKIKAGEGWRIEYFQLQEKLNRSYNAGKSEGIEETIAVINLMDAGETNPEIISQKTGVSKNSVKRIMEERITQ